MKEQIEAYILAHPWMLTTIIILQGARVIFKPLCLAAQTYVDNTVDKADDEILIAVQRHWAFKAVAFVLDWSLSIKIPEKKEAVKVA